VLVLIQTNTAPWLPYLPANLAKMVLFHDVRSQPGATSLRRDNRALRAFGRQERQIGQEADVIAFVSDLDQQRALPLRPRAEMGVSPIPIDLDYYLPAPPDYVRDPRPAVLFTGHLTHPPNVDAVVWFIEAVWPEILRHCPDAVFRVAGCLPAERVRAACASAAGVELHPDVPDIRPFFWNASAFVVPMRFGGGVRQKIFEAWAMRVPVVCTAMATEGTRAKSGVNCWIEDEPEAMAARLVALLGGRLTGADEVRERAAQTVAEFNSIPAAAARFAGLVERAAAIRRARPFKLLLDLRWMEIGKAGGMEQLAYEHLDALSRLDRRNAYRVLAPRSTYGEWNFPAGFQCRGIFNDRNDSRAGALRAAAANALSERAGLPPILTPQMRALRFYHKLDFDLVHSVCSYIHPDLAIFPHVLTMCDLQHVHFPEFFSPGEWQERDSLYRGSCERARHILCISEYTRQDLHAQYGIPLDRMTTVWVIPSRAAWLTLPPDRARTLLAGMGLETGRFFFFPAHPWPHKNHARLIEAMALIAKDLPPEVRLVLTGKPFPEGHPALAAIAGARLERRVVHLGYRSPLEIRALYGGALALVFPSLFEGFGMPVAEAMIAGCPVACSNTTSLPEIAGDAAIQFDPASVPSIAGALLRLATDTPLRESLREAGHRRRALFSARLSAVKTLAIYQRVYSELTAS
jgi:glycosyltransferase involved in cell wall biosynthesis